LEGQDFAHQYLTQAILFHFFMNLFLSNAFTQNYGDTVDGRNSAPHEMYKTL